ncbi:hypothetical protein M1555_04195 [Patescibacteria group bacterium]|nr:hypothetical protein [Patescibacteria group bacterium]
MHETLAQLTNPVLPPIIGQGGSASGIRGAGIFISNLISIIFIVSFLLAFFFLLTGAISWITSGGDKTNLENARNRIIHSLMGLIIVAAAWAIMVLVGQFIGLDIRQLPIPSISGQ